MVGYRVSSGRDIVLFVAPCFRHASAMNIQQWWSTNFEASLVGIEMELRILWWVYMQPRHSRASLWTKNHAKRVFSAFFIALNVNPLNLKPFQRQPEGPESVFGLSWTRDGILTKLIFFADMVWWGLPVAINSYLWVQKMTENETVQIWFPLMWSLLYFRAGRAIK